MDETKHNLITHENCNIPDCAICSGEVQICMTCGGAKTPDSNSLTTHCVGKQLPEDKLKAIAEGHLDYKNFRWHDKRLGPTIKEIAKSKGIHIDVGHIACSVDPEKADYICVGVYENSNEQTMYAWHEIMTSTNREDVGFLSLIHYNKFKELFGEL